MSNRRIFWTAFGIGCAAAILAATPTAAFIAWFELERLIDRRRAAGR